MVQQRQIKKRDIEIARLESKLTAVEKEVHDLRKQVVKQDSTIQEQHNTIAELNIQLGDLQGKYEALNNDKVDTISTLKNNLDKLPTRDEYDNLKFEHEKISKQLKDTIKQLKRRENQVRKLTEENLKIKDKLKFLKQEGL